MRRLRTGCLALALLTGTLALVGARPADAAAILHVDRAYGTQGIASFGSDLRDAFAANAFEVLADGSTIGGFYGGIRKIGPTGAIDTSFRTKAGQVDHSISATAIDGQGRVVAAGVMPGDPAHPAPYMVLRRYLADGTPDAALDGDGRRDLTDAPLSSQVADVVVDPLGRLVLLYTSADYVNKEQCTVRRYLANGVLDATFGTSGQTIVDLPDSPGTGPGCQVLHPRSDGSVLVLNYLGVALLGPDGVQGTYGGPGQNQWATSTYAIETSTMFPDGRLAIGTRGSDPFGREQFRVQVLTAAGIPDNTFSGDSQDEAGFDDLTAYSGGGDSIGWLDVAPDGDLVAGGSAINGLGLVRWQSGQRDATFGTDGELLVRDHELGGPYPQFTGIGGVASDGSVRVIAAPDNAGGVLGAVKITGFAPANLTMTYSPTSGPPGTVITISGSGCPDPQVFVDLLESSPSFPLPGSHTPRLNPSSDGVFSGSITIPPEPTGSFARPDHRYQVGAWCQETSQTVNAGFFTYTPAGTTWQGVSLLPLQASDQTQVLDLNDQGVSVGRSGTKAVRWDPAGNPVELPLPEGCTAGVATAIADGTSGSAAGVATCADSSSVAVTWDGVGDPTRRSFGATRQTSPFSVEDVNRSGWLSGMRPTGGGKGEAAAFVPGHPAVDLYDVGAKSVASAITDYGFLVGTIQDLQGPAGTPNEIAVGWYGPQVFPLVATPFPARAVDVTEGAYSLIQIDEDGDTRSVIATPQGTFIFLDATGRSDQAVSLNEGGIAVGRRRTSTAPTVDIGVFYAFGTTVRLDSLVTPAARSTFGFNGPAALNDGAWVVGTDHGVSWLLKPPGA